MSMALFLNTLKPVSKEEFCNIKDCFKRQDVEEVDFRIARKLVDMKGENYYFDSMWTPFLLPLSAFRGLSLEEYARLHSILEGVKRSVRYLLRERGSVTLFLASVEDREVLIKERVSLNFSELHENRRLEWGSVYEISEVS